MKIKIKIRKDKKNNQHALLSEIFYRETSSKNKNKNNKEKKKYLFLYVVGMFSMPFPPPPGILVFVGKAFIPPDREEKLGECHGS